MLDERFVIVGALVNFFGAMGYLISTVKGDTKPNRVTWFLWALAPMLAVSAQLKQGVGLAVLPSFMAGFNPALIFLASFINKKSQWRITKLDVTCGILSVLGLVLWQITQIPNLAILFAIFADGLAAVPTLVKSYTNPETENSIAFYTGAFSASTAILTITVWDFAHIAFPTYLVVVCVILVLLIQFKLGKKLGKVIA